MSFDDKFIMGILSHDDQALIVTNTESRWDKVIWYNKLSLNR